MKNVVSAGDSFPCGMGLGPDRFEAAYPVRIANEFGAKLTSIARPGCCNFAISLMVKWMVDNYNEDTFYVISTTNEDRLHWLRPGIVYNHKHVVGLEELNYEDYLEFLLTDLPFSPNNTINSETCSNILLHAEGNMMISTSLCYRDGKTFRSREPENRTKALDQYIKLLHDSKLKRFQDISLLSLQLKKLQEKGNNWVLLTPWHELENEFKDNAIETQFGTLSGDYPDDRGSGHFNATGHRIIYNNFMKWYNAR
jgi:hypothetical protein